MKGECAVRSEDYVVCVGWLWCSGVQVRVQVQMRKKNKCGINAKVYAEYKCKRDITYSHWGSGGFGGFDGCDGLDGWDIYL